MIEMREMKENTSLRKRKQNVEGKALAQISSVGGFKQSVQAQSLPITSVAPMQSTSTSRPRSDTQSNRFPAYQGISQSGNDRPSCSVWEISFHAMSFGGKGLLSVWTSRELEERLSTAITT